MTGLTLFACTHLQTALSPRGREAQLTSEPLMSARVLRGKLISNHTSSPKKA